MGMGGAEGWVLVGRGPERLVGFVGWGVRDGLRKLYVRIKNNFSVFWGEPRAKMGFASCK